MPFVAIDIPPDEFAVALQFLKELGLEYAAVTAPLKKPAWAHANIFSPQARQSQAVNTIYMEGGRVHVHNTDIFGLARP